MAVTSAMSVTCVASRGRDGLGTLWLCLPAHHREARAWEPAMWTHEKPWPGPVEPWRALAASWVGLEGLVGWGHTSQPPPEAPGGKNPTVEAPERHTVEAHSRGLKKRPETCKCDVGIGQWLIKGPIKKGPSSIRSRQRRIGPRPIASMGYSIPQAAYKNVRLLFSPDALPPCSTSPLFCTLAQRRITICSHPFLRSTCATICRTHQSCLCLVSDAIPISTRIASVRTEPTPAPLPFLPLLRLESPTRLRPPCVPVWLELLLLHRIRPFLRAQSALHHCYTSSQEGTCSMHFTAVGLFHFVTIAASNASNASNAMTRYLAAQIVLIIQALDA